MFVDGGFVLNPFKASLSPLGQKQVIEKKEDVVMGANTIQIHQKYHNLDKCFDTAGVKDIGNLS